MPFASHGAIIQIFFEYEFEKELKALLKANIRSNRAWNKRRLDAERWKEENDGRFPRYNRAVKESAVGLLHTDERERWWHC